MPGLVAEVSSRLRAQALERGQFRREPARFTRQAYERRKFAFVTDYVRLYALKSFGGIYMDTDVEVLRSLDDLLGLPGFTGFESNCLAADGTARLQERGALGSIC